MKFLLVLFLDMGSCSIAPAGVQWCHHSQDFESSLANIMSFHLHKTKKKVKTNQIHAYSFALLLEFSQYQLFHTTFFQLLEYCEITLFWSFITIFLLLLINMLCQGKQFIILNDFGQKSYQ
uniref:Uncharacterized protein n=1 Tax=Mandrillus leucophaeus TaxID=9568 RepID=A0A2K5Z265_MANLE